MKAAIIVKSREPLVVDDLAVPNDLAAGQVFVKIDCSGICGAQINEIDAVKGQDQFLPHLLGHEGVGKVEEIGAGVTTVKPGDRVVLHWRPSKGIQSATPQYHWKHGKVNAGWVTTFNDYAVVSENRLTVIPIDIDERVAILFGCAVTTAFGVADNDARIKIGQSVVIFGIGGVGINIAQAAKLKSAYPIVGIDKIESKLMLGRKLGLTHTLNSGRIEELRDEILEIVGGNGADVVIDTTGNSRIIEQAYDLTSPDGKTILVGVPNKGDNISIPSLPLHFDRVLTGSHGGGSIPDQDIPRLIRLMEAGKVSFDGLVTHEFPLEEINEAIKLVRSGEAGRVMINMI
jgi:S-(hydroxymethyl)glutathione dehydrogenase/alcohol dehydrogenase